MSRRLGTRRNVRGRRQVVWYFVCPICKRERDVLAKKRPTGDPDDFPAPLCDHGHAPARDASEYDTAPMENRGLFLLSLVHGKKQREPATKLRKEWARFIQTHLQGPLCICGHYRRDHRPTPPHGCRRCGCVEFTLPEAPRPYEYPHDEDVPF